MMVVVMVMMVTGAGGVRMRLAGGVGGRGDRRAGDGKTQNQGGQKFFHDHLSCMGAPVQAHFLK